MFIVFWNNELRRDRIYTTQITHSPPPHRTATLTDAMPPSCPAADNLASGRGPRRERVRLTIWFR